MLFAVVSASDERGKYDIQSLLSPLSSSTTSIFYFISYPSHLLHPFLSFHPPHSGPLLRPCFAPCLQPSPLPTPATLRSSTSINPLSSRWTLPAILTANVPLRCLTIRQSRLLLWLLLSPRSLLSSHLTLGLKPPSIRHLTPSFAKNPTVFSASQTSPSLRSHPNLLLPLLPPAELHHPSPLLHQQSVRLLLLMRLNRTFSSRALKPRYKPRRFLP